MNVRLPAGLLLCVSLAALAACRTPPSVGTTVQEDAHTPLAWRPLSSAEKTTFDLGYSVFNTEWAPANTPAGRTDGLGPIFNQQSCDSCHNSRRRGRGPRGDGDAPGDLVIQLGRVQADGHIERGTHEYGLVLNTSAVRGFTPEAAVSIQFEEQILTLKDGAQVHLRIPTYRVAGLSGPPLAPNTVLMPRMAPSVYGVGLIERVPAAAIAKLAFSTERRLPPGRFGWQATEPTVASQTASALGREMGLTSALVTHIDCGDADEACRIAPSGGSPEVEQQLFEPPLLFQELHSVPVTPGSRDDAPGLRLFKQAGCASCHVSSLPVELAATDRATRWTRALH